MLQLPPPFANTIALSLETVSDFDDDGPMWKWHNIHTGEHTGTHVDAPAHWVTGKDGWTVDQVPPARLVGPAVVVDVTHEVAADPDFLLSRAHLLAWEDENGRIPDNALGAAAHRLVRPRRRPGDVSERRREQPAHARVRRSRPPAGSPASGRSPGTGSRPSASTRAAGGMDRPFRRTTTCWGPASWVSRSCSSSIGCRPRAPSCSCSRCGWSGGRAVRLASSPSSNGPDGPDRSGAGGRLVGQAVAELGAGHAFGVVGSGNLAVTNALGAAGVPFVAARHEGGAATMADAYARTSGRVGV